MYQTGEGMFHQDIQHGEESYPGLLSEGYPIGCPCYPLLWTAVSSWVSKVIDLYISGIPFQCIQAKKWERLGWGRQFRMFLVFMSILTSTQHHYLLGCEKGLLAFVLLLRHDTFWPHSFRFVYKFVCDLKNLLGYSAGELSRLVLEAEETASDLEPGTNGGH